MEETTIQHNNQPCNQKKQQLTNKESKVLVVEKEEEGANVPKNGAFNVVLGMTPSGGVLKWTKYEMWHFPQKIHVGFY